MSRNYLTVSSVYSSDTLGDGMTDSGKTRYKFGFFEADLLTRELWKGGVKLKLGGQPFEILAALLERPGQMVTREELRTRIWSADTFVDFNHGLNAAVNKLREALSDSADDPRYIETLPRRGYRFIGTIAETDMVVAKPVEVSHLISLAPPLSQPPSRRPNLAVVITGFSLLVVFLTLLVFVTRRAEVIHAVQEREMKLSYHPHPVRAPSIWRLDLAHIADASARTLVTSARDRNEGPQPSPDGSRLAFMSDRSGSLEIWTSNLDGTELARLTNVGSAGTPRWSPDGKYIAFDSTRDGRPGIFTVPANGGEVTTLVEDASENLVPSWSRDGKWIYLASNRSGKDQVMKVSATGGAPLQVTQGGGFAAVESFDGRALFYAKTRFNDPEIWQLSTATGEERLASALLHPGTWANWSLTPKGIFFLDSTSGENHSLKFFDFATQTVNGVCALDHPSFWLSASSDGRFIWYAQGEPEETDQPMQVNMK